MPKKQHVTVFTKTTGTLLSVVSYNNTPIPSDYLWGAYRRFVNGDITFHIFQRGGILSDEALKGIVETYRLGKIRRLDDI